MRFDSRSREIDREDELTVTLCWQRELTLQELNFSNPNDPRIGIINAAEFENLDLLLFACDSNGNPQGAAVRSSVSPFSPVEHIFARPIPQSSLYLIRVRWTATAYDLFNRRPLAEQLYGLSWRVDFSPRPASLAATDLQDITSALLSFGTAVGNQAYSMDCDRDYNGRVDFRDLINILSNFNPTARAR